jgi:uncharacterized RDD family membrane protein YckC
MKSGSYDNIVSAAYTNLQANFPTVFMITFLIPFYYLVQKLAIEKAGKTREGMKMMGLKDSTYFASWFVFFNVIIIGMSLIISILIGTSLFSNSSFGLIFIMCFLYGAALYG